MSETNNRFHAMRRALQSAVLQLEIARITAQAGGDAEPPLNELEAVLARITRLVSEMEAEQTS